MVRMPFSYRDETRELDDLTRKEASGSFIRLSGGFTHYELSNPDAKETVVLVHGFSIPYFIFDPTFAFLTQSGFRTLRYDLFGRGFSDRPQTDYNIELFVRQLRDLLDGLGLSDPVSLVGLSTGGPITAAFTARFPERVHKLVLIDPVGARPFPLGRILKLMAAPFAGEVLIGLLWSIRVVKKLASRLPDREQVGEFGPRYIPQMQYKGFKRALLSTIRNHMLDSFLDVYERVGKMNKPVLLFWGPHDRTVPFEHHGILRRAIPNVHFHAIEDTGHIPHYEKPEEVNPILLKFLKG
jgi:pimeloyl-ACP methyl ester carboxylesterase